MKRSKEYERTIANLYNQIDDLTRFKDARLGLLLWCMRHVASYNMCEALNQVARDFERNGDWSIDFSELKESEARDLVDKLDKFELVIPAYSEKIKLIKRAIVASIVKEELTS